MFDSGITAAELIGDIQDEADISLDIPNKLYVQWLNSVEQLLYSEIIQEQRSRIVDRYMGITEEGHEVNVKKEISFTDFLEEKKSDEDEMRFSDIVAVYNSGQQLIKATFQGAVYNGFEDCYYYAAGKLGLSIKNASEITVIYNARPVLKSLTVDDEVGDGNVMVPVEFIDLIKAKLRGEAYKLANEDVLAAKWLNDYNVLLDTFRAWAQGRAAQFGE
ncbi:MAG: hypothetical protein ACI4EA_09400 [Candidatus Ornithomonoglobus sp.]